MDCRADLAATYGRERKFFQAGTLYYQLIQETHTHFSAALKLWNDWSIAATLCGKPDESCQILKWGAESCKGRFKDHSAWVEAKKYLEQAVDFFRRQQRYADALEVQQILTNLVAHEPSDDD